MKIFYIEDPNGEYYSSDGKRRFTKMNGLEAREYLRSERKAGRNRKFLLTETEERDVDELFDEIYIEIPTGSVSRFRKAERRKQYVRDCKEASGFETLSYNAPIRDNEELTIEDVVADSLKSVEDDALHEIELEIMRRALKTLTDEELRIIYTLYLSKKPISETRLSKELNIPRTTLQARKYQIFEKIKKYLNNFRQLPKKVWDKE